MTAKEYLNQTYRIDQMINSKIEQIRSLKELSTKISSVLNDMPSSSKDVHSKENSIVKMLDMENELKADIEKMVKIKQDVAQTISEVKDKECRLLLEMRYLNFMSWVDISIAMNRSLRGIYYLHSQALKKVEKIKKSLHLIALLCTVFHLIVMSTVV